MNHIEVEFRIIPLQPARALFCLALEPLNCNSFVETSEGLLAYWAETDFSEQAIIQLVENHGDVSITYAISEIEERNWNAEWERDFEPIMVGKDVGIRAPFHNPLTCQHEIIINPQMAFGTGHHQTTQLMIELMLETVIARVNVADVGCGTGVLAILAQKLGANQVNAVDIEEWAYNNTHQNIALNNAVGITVEKGSFDLLQPLAFTTILANINKNVLIQDMESYIQSLNSGGHLLISGFFSTDIEGLKTLAEKSGLIFAKKRENQGWAALKFIKP